MNTNRVLQSIIPGVNSVVCLGRDGGKTKAAQELVRRLNADDIAPVYWTLTKTTLTGEPGLNVAYTTSPEGINFRINTVVIDDAKTDVDAVRRIFPTQVIHWFLTPEDILHLPHIVTTLMPCTVYVEPSALVDSVGRLQEIGEEQFDIQHRLGAQRAERFSKLLSEGRVILNRDEVRVRF